MVSKRRFTVQRRYKKSRLQMSRVARFKRMKVMFERDMWGPLSLKGESCYVYKNPKILIHISFAFLSHLVIEHIPP